MVIKDKYCINCEKNPVYVMSESFADITDFCGECYFNLKIQNQQSEINKLKEQVQEYAEKIISICNKSRTELETCVETINLQSEKLNAADESYAQLAEEFLAFLNSVKKPTKKRKVTEMTRKALKS